MALKMKNVIQAKAKEKQQGGQGGILLLQKSEKAKQIHTDEELSKLAGVSRWPSVSVSGIRFRSSSVRRQGCHVSLPPPAGGVSLTYVIGAFLFSIQGERWRPKIPL